jgi:hypothetical protein
MASSKLFSYNIEENDGRLVITIEGAYAKSVIDYMRSEVDAGRGWRVLSRISPVGPIHRLSRQAFRAQQEQEQDEAAAEGGALDLDTIFKQGFAETYEGFASGLDRFGATLNELRTELMLGQAAKRNAEGADRDAQRPAAEKKSAK